MTGVGLVARLKIRKNASPAVNRAGFVGGSNS